MDRQDAQPSAGAAAPATIRLADYAPPVFLIDTVDLDIDLRDDVTTVRSRLAMRRNPASSSPSDTVRLDGEDQEIVSVLVNGVPLEQGAYQVDGDGMALTAPSDAFTVEITTRIKPQDNTRLEGLYLSDGLYCTQCEAEGFRRITYFPDRPDVLAVYTTRIAADAARFPVLLSNGNPTESGALPNGRHFATWHDPFPKPSYLFAMVAGDLGHVEERFTTRSGREVTLRIYVEPGNEPKAGHAMRSLVRSMEWDEEVYGLEYDLDLFMIVAVGSFNMGAMENKGLNIFNSKYVLADEASATDVDFQRIEGIVAHEYFHNWTGNRVTCRDWFQLSLKEGLTVFRDQEFSADVHSRGVKRVGDVRTLRAVQFQEDAGPTAHPVRPESYIEINNFYTPTVYEKGAEVVRMIHTLIGAQAYRAGIDLYFERHDGDAVTCEDFVKAMEDASGADLSRFRLWYAQAGTPTLTARLEHDAERREAVLTLAQSTPPTPGQSDKQPMPIPVAVGLIGPDGKDLPLRLQGDGANDEATTRVLRLEGALQRFVFTDVAERPVPSLLRGFSAPVKLDNGLSIDDLAFLMAHDSDPFVRWDSGQRYAGRVMLDAVAAIGRGEAPVVPDQFIDALAATLTDERLEPAFRGEALGVPSETEIALAMEEVDVDGVHAAREHVRTTIGTRLWDALAETYRRLGDGYASTDMSTEAMGARRLRNQALSYLVATGRDDAVAWAAAQAGETASMTNRMAALAALNDLDRPERQAAMEAFHADWRHDPLVLDKWFALEAMSAASGTLDRVRELMAHPGFDIVNPNRVRALVASFTTGNPYRFHAADGAGYRFLADRVIEIDPRNPQLAARLLLPLTRWRRYDSVRQDLMRGELRRIVDTENLSKDSYEIASKGLA